MTATKASVTKTATDALLAKLSAFEAGHCPLGTGGDTNKSNKNKNNNTGYHDLLRQMMKAVSKPSFSSFSKRQTPLVNAGYAARIAAMTFLVEEFVLFHSTTSSVGSSPINIVLMGCGLDVLSLYGYSLQPNAVRVYEIDCPEICMVKRNALLSMDMLQSSSSPSTFEESSTTTTTEGQSTLYQGFLKFPQAFTTINKDDDNTPDNSSNTTSIPNYTLLSADLKDISSFQSSLESTTLDTSYPTLVISELVLAYLGKNGCDDILTYCGSQLCTVPGSVVIAYEPLGPEEMERVHSHEGVRIVSVTDGYKRSYRKQFQLKLQRGSANNKKTTKENDDNDANHTNNNDVFHPLGSSCLDVEKRLKQVGFSSSHACYAGIMVATATGCHTRLRQPNKNNTSSCAFPTTEPFDEHAALALHLRSYVVTCAFAKGTPNEIECHMCPWSRKAAIGSLSITTENGILLSHIQKCDQEEVRDLFAKTYCTLYDDYPAVKKMVKTALKSDLSDKIDDDSTDADVSVIGHRYMDWGGIFLVAIDNSTPDNNRRVVGCVGLRPCKRDEGDIRGNVRHSYEIHRLAVNEDCRGMGIGKALLLAVDRFVSLSLGRPNVKFQIVATTPEILIPANEVYQKMGFGIKEEKLMGKIRMNTYVKESKTEMLRLR